MIIEVDFLEAERRVFLQYKQNVYAYCKYWAKIFLRPKLKLPRKLKKYLKTNHVILDQNAQMNINWFLNKRMVIVHNYVLAKIDLNLTKEDKNFIKNGLLVNPKFKHTYK